MLTPFLVSMENATVASAASMVTTTFLTVSPALAAAARNSFILQGFLTV